MKVLKVIVDEIPSCCRVCEYLVRNSMLASTPNGCHCGLTAKFMTIEMTETRPDWCPLVASEDLAVSEDGCHWLVEIPGACENERIVK